MDLKNVRIPRFFSYDLFARVIPGVATLFAILLVIDTNLGKVATAIFGSEEVILKSTVLTLLFVLTSGFLVGMITGSLSSILENIVSKLSTKNFNLVHYIATTTAKDVSGPIRGFVMSQVDKSDSYRAHLNLLYGWYDEIRMRSERISEQVTRTRAEIRMYSGLVAGLVLTTIVYALDSEFEPSKQELPLAAGLVVSITMLIRSWGRASYQFQNSIVNHYLALIRSEEPALAYVSETERFDVGQASEVNSLIGIIGHDHALQMLMSCADYSFVDERIVSTPFGQTVLIKCKYQDREFLFAPRYRKDSTTNRRIKPKSMIYALSTAGARTILSVNGVGSINSTIQVGDFAVPCDFIDLAFAEDSSYYTTRPSGVFVRMNPPFCPSLGAETSSALSESGATVHTDVVYASVQGSRLETPAEVKMLKMLGADIVSMRVGTEASLCRELALCYSPICFSLNQAEGTDNVEPGPSFTKLKSKIDQEDVNNKMTLAISKILRTYLTRSDSCKCANSLDDLSRKDKDLSPLEIALEGIGSE